MGPTGPSCVNVCEAAYSGHGDGDEKEGVHTAVRRFQADRFVSRRQDYPEDREAVANCEGYPRRPADEVRAVAWRDGPGLSHRPPRPSSSIARSTMSSSRFCARWCLPSSPRAIIRAARWTRPTAAEVRVSKIAAMIGECDWGIHDLS